MRNKDTFSSYHPAINFLFFGLVLIFTMFLMHPACLLISFGCSVAYNISLNGRKAAGFSTVLLVLVLLKPRGRHDPDLPAQRQPSDPGEYALRPGVVADAGVGVQLVRLLYGGYDVG